MRKFMNDTIFFRFIAILLITNSHLDKLYPIPMLGSGGALGNSLFFMISGLGLALSGKMQTLGFPIWFRHRVSKIYASLWPIVIVFPLVLFSEWKHWSITDYSYHLLYPTTYWFISAIIVF